MRTTDKQLRDDDDQPDFDTMRYDLAEREAMNMGVSEIIDLLLNGFEGLDNLDDLEIRDEWEQIFGKSVDNPEQLIQTYHMNLEKAIELVLNEAESSALGDNNREVLEAIELLQSFYEQYGHQFQNFEVEV